MEKRGDSDNLLRKSPNHIINEPVKWHTNGRGDSSSLVMHLNTGNVWENSNQSRVSDSVAISLHGLLRLLFFAEFSDLPQWSECGFWNILELCKENYFTYLKVIKNKKEKDDF